MIKKHLKCYTDSTYQRRFLKQPLKCYSITSPIDGETYYNDWNNCNICVNLWKGFLSVFNKKKNVQHEKQN